MHGVEYDGGSGLKDDMKLRIKVDIVSELSKADASCACSELEHPLVRPLSPPSWVLTSVDPSPSLVGWLDLGYDPTKSCLNKVVKARGLFKDISSFARLVRNPSPE